MGKVEGFFLCIFLFTMVILAFLQVVMRDLFNQGFPWADTVVRHLVLWVAFSGAALATKLEQNLTVEVLTKYLPERAKHLSSVVVKSFAITVCFYLLCASLRFLADERTTGEQFIGLFPSWWSLAIMPVTFALIPFHLIISIINDVRYFVKGKAS
ncbi:MAG: TRAP transporter small permease [Deltaproteobacteria bacterium]|nr:TRAP transporter small permease [Deltaproteobacteria bacterium]